jgi:hypothetical protein
MFCKFHTSHCNLAGLFNHIRANTVCNLNFDHVGKALCCYSHFLVGRSSVTCLQRLWNTHQFIQDSTREKIELTMGAWFWQLHKKCDLLYLCQMWWVHVLPQALNWLFQEAAYNHFQKILSPQHCHILLYEVRHTQGSRQLIIISGG